MVERRAVLALLASAMAVSGSGVVFAQKGTKKEKKKNHKDGRAILGGKVKVNGKHKVDKAGRVEVSAEVANGKVVGLLASDPSKGNLPVRKVKSKKKLAEAVPGIISAKIELAQYSDYYYGYWFDDGEDDWYYWFTADMVIIDDSWIEYY